MQKLETVFSFEVSKINKDALNKTVLKAAESCLGRDMLGQMMM